MGLATTPGREDGDPTILVVDDDAAALKLCRETLEGAGYAVLVASGSSDALKLIKNHEGRIDMLVTDLILPPPGFSLASSANEFPHVHGPELVLRALRMRQDLHVLLMSGNIEQEMAGSEIRKDALPFLAKPIDPKSLVALVKEVRQTPPPSPNSLVKTNSGGSKGADEWFD